MAMQLSSVFNNSFNNSKHQRQPKQRFKQVDITKTINFNQSKKKIKKR